MIRVTHCDGLGLWTLRNGMVAQQDHRPSEYSPDGGILFDRLCGGRSDSVCRFVQFQHVGGSG
jgi:hypothetical protein